LTVFHFYPSWYLIKNVRPPPDLIQRSGRRVVAAGLVGPTRSSQGASISAGGCRTPWLERRRQYRSPALRIGIVAARPVYLLAVYIEELFSSSRQRSPGPAPNAWFEKKRQVRARAGWRRRRGKAQTLGFWPASCTSFSAVDRMPTQRSLPRHPFYYNGTE